jgi:uncharacterized protein (DUF2147 family)
MIRRLYTPVLVLLAAAAAQAQAGSVLGNWRNPTGSTIQIYRCGSNVCARLVEISKSDPHRTDGNNPKAALRSRPLCDLQIGSGFRLVNPGSATGGQLYDPKSGKTYSGSMTLAGEKLKLHGYVVFSILGRTETWTRAPADFTHCHP